MSRLKLRTTCDPDRTPDGTHAGFPPIPPGCVLCWILKRGSGSIPGASSRDGIEVRRIGKEKEIPEQEFIQIFWLVDLISSSSSYDLSLPQKSPYFGKPANASELLLAMPGQIRCNSGRA